jgi:hypothetical protein
MGKSQDLRTAATTTVGAPGPRLPRYQSLTLISAFLGWIFEAPSRRTSYLVFSLGSLVVSLVSFMAVRQCDDVLLWMMPVFGYCVIGAFGPYAARLPKLFPARARASGPAFCWNMTHALASIGPLVQQQSCRPIGLVSRGNVRSKASTASRTRIGASSA